MKVSIPNQRRVIAFYGPDAQSRVHMEECAELIQAISKMRRAQNRSPEIREIAFSNLIEELADVLISMEQIMEMYDISNPELQAEIERKVRRQEERMHDDV